MAGRRCLTYKFLALCAISISRLPLAVLVDQRATCKSGRCLLSDCSCVLSICRTVRIHRGAFPSCSSPREIYIRRCHASHSTFSNSVIALGHHARSPIHPRRLDKHPPRGGHGRAYHCAHSPWTCVTVLPLSLLQLDGARARRAHLRGIPRHSRWDHRRLHRTRHCRCLGGALLFATTAHCGMGARKHKTDLLHVAFSFLPPSAYVSAAR
jgi:hypothetical protein